MRQFGTQSAVRGAVALAALSLLSSASANGQNRAGSRVDQPTGPTVTGTVLDLPAHSLVYSSVTKVLYASVRTGGQGETSNSITLINPETGDVFKSIPLTMQPDNIALSAEDKYLYAGVSDGTGVRRINLSTGVVAPLFQLGGGLSITSMTAVPGVPEAVAIARHRPGVSPDNAGMAVYVNGLQVGDITEPGHQLAQGIGPSRWFGYENQMSTWSFYTLNIGRTGVTSGGSSGSVLSGNQTIPSSANGLMVTGGGSVLDPEARQVLGKIPGLNSNGRGIGDDCSILALGSTGVVYSVSGRDGNYRIRAAGLYTTKVIGELSVNAPGAKGYARGLVYAGENALAFTTGESVVIVHLNLGRRLPQVDLSVKRSKLPIDISRGSEVTYTLTVKNNSGSPSSHVYLTDQMQQGVEPISASASQGDAIVADRILRADLGELAAGASAVVTVRVRITETDKLGFAAVVRGEEPDPVGDNNIDIFGGTDSLRLADLAVSWTGAEQRAAGSGVNLQVTIYGVARVSNIGKKNSTPCSLRFWAGSGPNFVPSLYFMLQEVRIPALAPGEFFDAELKAPLDPGDDATGVYIFAQADPRNEVEEKTKDNNVARTQIK